MSGFERLDRLSLPRRTRRRPEGNRPLTYVTTRVAEACHNSRLHRIGAGGKDNGNSGSRRFRRKGDVIRKAGIEPE